MAVLNVWVGAVTDSSAWVRAKIDAGASNVRLALDQDDTFPNPQFVGPVSPSAQDVVSLEPTALASGTQYYYALEIDSVLDTATMGRFRTHDDAPGKPVSFDFWAAGDAGSEPLTEGVAGSFSPPRISNHTIFDTVRQHDPDFGIMLGDIHYYNPGQSGSPSTGGSFIGDTVTDYRRCIDDVLLQPRQHQLYREIPVVWIADDHDFGPNNSDGTHPTKANFAQVYRERVPHYSLPDPDGGAVYHAFEVGRVLFAILDVRYYRSPNDDPDDDAKTMLGQGQKEWLRSTLSASDAEALMVVSPVQWLAGSTPGESWGAYSTERAELADMFVELGWADRMVMLQADIHAMAMASGEANPYGGFPCWVFASLDASPSGTGASGLYDIGFSNAREQYGDISVTDDGDTITIHADGYQADAVLMSDELVISTVEPEPEPDPDDPDTGLAPVAQAVIRTRLTWLACNLSDGQVITELPDLQGDEVSRVIGEYTSANLSLPIPAVGGRDLALAQRAQLAIQSTQPPRTKIVAVANDVPAWEGIPLPRDLGTDAEIPLGCVSMEGYLRHVYIGDHAFDGVDVAVIADGILRDAVTTPHGPGIALTIDAPNIGTTASRSYLDIDDQTVYAGLRELMDAGLIEWTLEPDWRMGFAYRIVDTIARVRGRLGSSGDVQAVFQSATFSSQGASDARYQLKEDYGGDRYANVIRLRGAGQGEDQPRSAPAINQGALDSGVPVWELRDSAPRNVTEQALLDLHAERRLDRVRDGAHTLEITARWDAPGARYAVDWQLGDDVRHELRGHAHPDGLDGVRRAIGFALSIQRGTIRPILQED